MTEAIEAEVADWIEAHTDVRDEHGRRRVIRNGYKPRGSILTGLGPVQVRQARVRDGRRVDDGETRLRGVSRESPTAWSAFQLSPVSRRIDLCSPASLVDCAHVLSP